MPYSIVQPWGRDRYRQATVQSVHDTVDDAYARLDAIAEKLQRDGAPRDYLELYVVDEQRQPVRRVFRSVAIIVQNWVGEHARAPLGAPLRQGEQR